MAAVALASGDCTSQQSDSTVLATKASSCYPLTALLTHLARYKALAIEKEPANISLAPLVATLLQTQHRDLDLKDLLVKFGWTTCGFGRTVDLAGLKSALQKYKYVKIEQLGRGSYGVVHKARNRETNELIAIKKLWHNAEEGFPDSTIREISTLKELRHENIVKLKDVISSVNGSHVYLVLECLDCDLRRYLDSYPDASSVCRVKSVVHQILRGVRHAHANCVMHRDLKPHNVLVDVATGRVKITDFGLARAFLPPCRAYTEKVVTLYYRAPELLLGAQYYSSAIDVWSVGCIMAELLNFEPLFKAESEIALLYRIFERLGTPCENHWSEGLQLPYFHPQFPKWLPKEFKQLVPRLAHDELGLDLLSRMLTYDPKQRITAYQALQHPWFKEFGQVA